jgi:hypothetical protein
MIIRKILLAVALSGVFAVSAAAEPEIIGRRFV